jgi:hypothetical protein
MFVTPAFNQETGLIFIGLKQGWMGNKRIARSSFYHQVYVTAT